MSLEYISNRGGVEYHDLLGSSLLGLSALECRLKCSTIMLKALLV